MERKLVWWLRHSPQARFSMRYYAGLLVVFAVWDWWSHSTVDYWALAALAALCVGDILWSYRGWRATL